MCKIKTILTHVRIPEDIIDDIKREAEKKGTDISKEVVYMLRHYKHPLTPFVVIKIQNIVNRACTIAMRYAPDIVRELQRDMNELWKYLK
ncbi:hypothetical protein [Ruminococcus flavefaciens]|uniref:Uncharacterized protein n=1 Tax=Ruminococcus flavefaciens TaxID=1265 RepID=A0A1M7G9C7_RUMFL|nr:hypothetical protein [Ruminococcus flavefaciens]SHM12786.1 hypothetical protein SAMN04487860_101139 [Ruminococcus flavefaciens]